jgi:sugar lactone lactonase YvrE
MLTFYFLANGLAVSSDGGHLYVAQSSLDQISWFFRDFAGVLSTLLGSIPSAGQPFIFSTQ